MTQQTGRCENPEDLIANDKRKRVSINRPSPMEAVRSLSLDTRRLLVALVQLRHLIKDKEHRDDFSPAEWNDFVDCLQQAVYIDHSVKRLLHSLGVVIE